MWEGEAGGPRIVVFTPILSNIAFVRVLTPRRFRHSKPYGGVIVMNIRHCGRPCVSDGEDGRPMPWESEEFLRLRDQLELRIR